MEKIIGSFTAWEIMCAAVIAFFITQLILRFKMVKEWMDKENEISLSKKELDVNAILNKCKIMFPIDTIIFKGKTFHIGMLVCITTDHRSRIEGKLVGKNDKNVLCVITRHHIIAHELEKIIEISVVEQEENT